MKKSLSSLRKYKINGVDQYLLESSNNSDKPVLLFVHGGPGSTLLPFSDGFDSFLRDEFIVVHWDQRCAGKSFNEENVPTDLRISDFIDDCVEVVKLLKNKYNKNLFLLGHSWGSLVALRSLDRLKDEVTAYIGVGQLVNVVEGQRLGYEFILGEAIKEDRLTIEKDLGVPPYRDASKVKALSDYVMKYGGIFSNVSMDNLQNIAMTSKYYTEEDWGNQGKGFELSEELLHSELESVNLIDEVEALSVSSYFIHGDKDFATPKTVLDDFLRKFGGSEVNVVSNAGHFPFWDQPEEFAKIVCNIRDLSC